MVSKEILKAHYVEYGTQPDEWVSNMEITKASIVEAVIKTAPLKTDHEPVKVCVLGASDKRYLPIHHRVFEKVLRKKIVIETLDIDAEHLGGESDTVVVHDVTKPFPKNYDMIFSHELMKFLTAEEQFLTIKNSFNALEEGGVAMHIMHEPSLKGTSELRTWQNRVDPDQLISQLEVEGIQAKKLVFESKSTVPWLRKTTVIILQK